MGGLTRKQLMLIVGSVLAIIGVIVIIVTSNGNREEASEVVPTGEPTIATQTPTATPSASEAFVPVPTATEVTPSAVPTASGGLPPALSPDLQIIDLGGPTSIDDMATPEEREFRDKAYAAIATYTNSAGPQYTDSSGARDELLSKGLITKNMAQKQFFGDWIEYQKEMNAAKYTVQTTGLYCALRGHTAGTIFDTGFMSCFQTREVVDETGNEVSFEDYKQSISYGMGAIDPDEQLRLRVAIVQEDGVWKIDAITNG